MKKKRTRSGFEYLLPPIKERFGKTRAREITPDVIQDFLNSLNRNGRPLGASSKNHYRTIINLVFNEAIRRGRYDRNPCSAVPQFREPPGREVLVEGEKLQDLLIEIEDDTELYVAVILLVVTNTRRNELLARKWTDVNLDSDAPRILVPQTKNDRPKNIPLPPELVTLVRKLPSFGKSEYLFPSRPTARAPKPKRPYRWDIGKQFRAAAHAVGLPGLRVHDLKHIGPSILLAHGIDETIVRKITGHRSKVLIRYQHLIPRLRSQTVNIVASELLKERE
jgi:integrase